MNFLNISGLLLDIIGAALVFFNSPEVTSTSYGYFINEAVKIEKKAHRKRKRARIGFALLAIGFILQIRVIFSNLFAPFHGQKFSGFHPNSLLLAQFLKTKTYLTKSLKTIIHKKANLLFLTD